MDSAPASPQSVTLTGTGTEPMAGLAPPSIDFGNQEVGSTSSPQLVTLTNSGNGALDISAISAASPFAETNNCGSSLAAGARCAISVTFAPAASGPASRVLTISDNASGGSQSAALSGIGTAPVVLLSPPSLSFGSINDGTTSPPQGVTLTNTGTAALSISSVSSGGDFSATSGCGTTLAAGSSCTINVTFAPATVGEVTGSLTVSDNAAGSPQQVTLSGTGSDPAPAVTLTPSSLAFTGQAVGTTSAPQQVTLTNTGTAALGVASVTASGDFSVAASCGVPLQPGQNCSASVTFKPTAQGARTGSLTFSDNATGSAQTVALSGEGLADFSLSSASAKETVLRGMNQANFAIEVSEASGFAGTISLACAGNGTASCTFSPSTVSAGGTSTLTVSNLASETGNTLTLTVTGESGAETASLGLSVGFMDFAINPNPSSATVTAGGTANYVLGLTPQNGFSAPVSFSCIGAPVAATCSVSPATATPNGASSTDAAVTVTTASQVSLDPFPRIPGIPGIGNLPRPLLELMLWLMAAAMLISTWIGDARPRRLRKLLFPVLLAFALGACGGGSGTNSAPSGPAGTPAGTYQLTVQATSGSLSHSAQITLIVN